MNGSGTWLGAGKDMYELCNKIQEFYWKTLLEVPYSTPKVALQCETGCMEMSLRIKKEKCLLLNRIKCLSEDFLVKEVCNTAMENGWPGLHSEVKVICEELMINDLNTNGYSKKELDQIFKLKQKEYKREPTFMGPLHYTLIHYTLYTIHYTLYTYTLIHLYTIHLYTLTLI